MTALVPISPPPIPQAPPELAQKLGSFDGMDLIRGTVSPVVVQQARHHLAALEAFHKPAGEQQIEAWCRMLRGGTAPIDEREFSSRLFAIRATCEDLPGWVWSRETLKLAWRECKFFPSAAEVFDILDAVAQKGLRGTSHVRMLAAATPAAALSAPDPTVTLAARSGHSVPTLRRSGRWP